jgi:hypothetical protein
MKFLGHFVVRAGGALVTCQSDLGLRRVPLSEFESISCGSSSAKIQPLLTPQLLLHTTFWFLTLPPSPFREIHCIYHSKIASDDYPILKTVHSIPSHLPLEPPQLHSTKGGGQNSWRTPPASAIAET